MDPSVYVFDPTSTDDQSRVRGVGRYLQLLRENFEGIWNFDLRPSTFDKKSDFVLIHPFFNLLQNQPPELTKRIAKKQIAVIHDLIPLKYPKHFPIGIKGKFLIFQNKRILKHYDLVVTDSQESKKDIVQMLQIKEDRVKVIHPSLPHVFGEKPTKQPLRLPFQLPQKFCLYVGDATWNKNLVLLARAVKRANVTCVIVGKVFINNQSLDHPWQKELREFFEEVRGDKRFLFTGFISDNDLIKLYSQTRLNILLSQDEGFGFSFLEASSQGCPSVLTDIPVFREIAGDSALFTSKLDPTEAANRIEELYFDDNKRQIMSIKALERSKIFSPENFKNEWRSTTLP